MKKFSALLFVTVLMTVALFASAALADTYVYTNNEGKVGVLLLSGDTLAIKTATNTSIDATNLGNKLKVFAESKDFSEAFLGGKSEIVKVKASGDVVYTSAKFAKPAILEVSNFAKSGDYVVAVGADGLFVSSDAKTKISFTSDDENLKAAVPMPENYSSPAVTPLVNLSKASMVWAASAGDDFPKEIIKFLTALNGSAPFSEGNVNLGLSMAEMIGTAAVQAALTANAKAAVLNSGNVLSFVDENKKVIASHSPVNGVMKLGSTGKIYMATSDGVRTDLGTVALAKGFTAAAEYQDKMVAFATSLKDFQDVLDEATAAKDYDGAAVLSKLSTLTAGKGMGTFTLGALGVLAKNDATFKKQLIDTVLNKATDGLLQKYADAAALAVAAVADLEKAIGGSAKYVDAATLVGTTTDEAALEALATYLSDTYEFLYQTLVLGGTPSAQMTALDVNTAALGLLKAAAAAAAEGDAATTSTSLKSLAALEDQSLSMTASLSDNLTDTTNTTATTILATTMAATALVDVENYLFFTPHLLIDELANSTALAAAYRTAAKNVTSKAVDAMDVLANLAVGDVSSALLTAKGLTAPSTSIEAIAKALKAEAFVNGNVTAIAADEPNKKIYALAGKKLYVVDTTATTIASVDITGDAELSFTENKVSVDMKVSGNYVTFIDDNGLKAYKIADNKISLVPTADGAEAIVSVARLNSNAWDGTDTEPAPAPTPAAPAVSLHNPADLGDAGTKIVSAFDGATAADFLTDSDVTSKDGTAATDAIKTAIQKDMDVSEAVSPVAIKDFTITKDGYILVGGSDVEKYSAANYKFHFVYQQGLLAAAVGDVFDAKAFDANGNEATSTVKYVGGGKLDAGTYTLYATAVPAEEGDEGNKSAGSSSGGCNAGFASIAALLALAFVKKSK